MAKVHFTSTIDIRGINPFILVSRARAAKVTPGWSKPLPVLIRINGKPKEPHSINMMPSGNGSFYLYLNGAVRAAAGVSVGDRVSVEIEFDSAYRGGPQHPAPAWFEDALERNPDAAGNWAALTPSRRKEILRYFAQLKSDEARERNLRKALKVLSGGAGRFMARSWKNGA